MAAPVSITTMGWKQAPIVPRIIGLFPIAFKRYIEPFAGSACVFAAAAPSEAILSDINAELMPNIRGGAMRGRPLYRRIHLTGNILRATDDTCASLSGLHWRHKAIRNAYQGCQQTSGNDSEREIF